MIKDYGLAANDLDESDYFENNRQDYELSLEKRSPLTKKDINNHRIMLAKKEQLLQQKLEKILSPKLLRKMMIMIIMNSNKVKSSKKHQAALELADQDESRQEAEDKNESRNQESDRDFGAVRETQHKNKVDHSENGSNDLLHMFHRFG